MTTGDNHKASDSQHRLSDQVSANTDQSCRIQVAEPERPLASTADRKNGLGLLSPPAGRGMLVQPQQAATVCELDLVQHAIESSKRAQTLDPNERPKNCPSTRKPDP